MQVLIPSPALRPKQPSLEALPPLALYVHIPWCVRKCPYCDFNSHEARGQLPEQRYVAALTADLEQALPLVWGRRVHCVFFGGGTPSLLSAHALDEILSTIRARLPLGPDAEITLEANPGTFEAQKFADFRALGINRLSIGIQSFDPQHLHALGRIHDEREARRAVEIAHANFDNFNLDLMYALPEQSVEEALADVEEALALGAAHLSHYQLTLEPGTAFHRHPPQLPGEDSSFEMQEACQARIAAAGYAQYEVSAYARPGRKCAHNLNYWQFGDYIGIGAGAHGKITRNGRIVRSARHRSPARYLSATKPAERVAEVRVVADDETPFEFCLNALRLVDGFETALFESTTGLAAQSIEAMCATAEGRGLLQRGADARWVPTPLGRRFLNDLQALFLPDRPQAAASLAATDCTGVAAPAA
jgi:oxygen-independent coproporphyrinogen-3 oxidase